MTATLHRIPISDPDAPTTASATVKIAAARDAARAAIREARAQLLVLECRL